MPDKKLNLHQKLIEIRKTVPSLGKDKKNKAMGFPYVSSSLTLGALKGAMDLHGVLLIPRVIGVIVKDHTTKGGAHEYFTEINFTFSWVNADTPDDKIVCPWYGQGLDSGEKGVGKAMTYAEKYFLLKFFNIPTDKDDPDRGKKPKGNASTQTTLSASASSSPQKEMGLCPKCGCLTIIEGKPEYGGGWLCWKNKGGCGAKFTSDPDATAATEPKPSAPAEGEERIGLNKQIHAVGKDRGLKHSDLHNIARIKYSIESLSDLTEDNAIDLMTFLRDASKEEIAAVNVPF